MDENLRIRHEKLLAMSEKLVKQQEDKMAKQAQLAQEERFFRQKFQYQLEQLRILEDKVEEKRKLEYFNRETEKLAHESKKLEQEVNTKQIMDELTLKLQAIKHQQSILQSSQRALREKEVREQNLELKKEKLQLQLLKCSHEGSSSKNSLEQELNEVVQQKKSLEQELHDARQEEKERYELLLELYHTVETLKGSQAALENKVEKVASEQIEINNKINELFERVEDLETLEKKITERFNDELENIQDEIREIQAGNPTAQAYQDMLQDMQAKYEAEKAKQELRSTYIFQASHPQLKYFYLQFQNYLNAVLLANKMVSTGYVGRGRKTNNIIDNSVSLLSSAFSIIPLPGAYALSQALAILIKRARNVKEEAKAEKRSDYFISASELEKLSEEVAFALTQHYSALLQEISLKTDKKKYSGITELARAAVERIIEYTQAVSEIDDPINSFILAVRTCFIPSHKKAKLALNDSMPSTNTEEMPFWKVDWTVHGFFSGSGLRTTTPRRRRFVNEHTESKRYGFIDISVHSLLKGMEEDKTSARKY